MMSSQLKGSLFYVTADVRRMLTIFWAILLGLLVISLLLNILVYKESIVTFQLSFPLYFLCAIVGQMIVKNTIPYLIKMGSTRSNIFKTIGVHFFNFALVNAVLASTIYGLTMIFFGSNESANSSGSMITITNTDGGQMRFDHFAEFFVNNWGTRILIDFSIMFFLLICGFILGLIFYRFGTPIGLSFIGIVIFIFIVGMARGWLLNFFFKIFSNMSLTFFVQLFLVGLIIYLLSYVVLRRLPIM